MTASALPAQSRATRVARQFFTHCGQVPLVLLILEALLAPPGYFGDTVNTAQRLCDAANPAQLLASAQACAAAGVPCQPRREVLAKGKSEPLVAAVLAA